MGIPDTERVRFKDTKTGYVYVEVIRVPDYYNGIDPVGGGYCVCVPEAEMIDWLIEVARQNRAVLDQSGGFLGGMVVNRKIYPIVRVNSMGRIPDGLDWASIYLDENLVVNLDWMTS